jgi:hypothetical protein
MVRTQIQLDEDTYKAARRVAFERHISLSAVVREALTASLPGSPKPSQRADFAFVAAGRSRQGVLAPVSERHDEALAEARARRKSR